MQIKGFLFSKDYLSQIRANDAEMSVLGIKTLRRNRQQFNAERIYFNKILLTKVIYLTKSFLKIFSGNDGKTEEKQNKKQPEATS